METHSCKRATKRKWPTEMDMGVCVCVCECGCVKQLLQIHIWAVWVFHLIAKLPSSSSITPHFFHHSVLGMLFIFLVPQNPLVSESHRSYPRNNLIQLISPLQPVLTAVVSCGAFSLPWPPLIASQPISTVLASVHANPSYTF